MDSVESIEQPWLRVIIGTPALAVAIADDPMLTRFIVMSDETDYSTHCEFCEETVCVC